MIKRYLATLLILVFTATIAFPTVRLENTVKRFVGTSSDTKPTIAASYTGSWFYETDTDINYIWDGGQWNRHFNSAAISFAQSQAVDAFTRLRVANPVSLFENKNIHSRNSHQWEEPLTGVLLVHGAVAGGPFQVAETITGGTSGAIGIVTAVNGGSLTLTISIDHNDWTDTETITGGTSGATATLTTHNTGTDIFHDRDTAAVVLQVGQVSGDQAVRQTHRYFSYVPGKSQEIWLTFLFGSAVTNVTRRSGYFDPENGVFLEQTSSGVSFVVRSKTSGSVVDTAIAQADWNGDKLDGTGDSGVTLDFSKTQFMTIDFQWQGVGSVRFGFFVNGKNVTAHMIDFANAQSTVYMSTPSLPVRHEITNTGATASINTMTELCTAVTSNGGENPSGLGFTKSNGTTGRSVTTTNTPILAIRLKNVHGGDDNRVTVELSHISVFITGNDNVHFELKHMHDPTGITATWNDVSDDSAVEFSTDISTITGSPEHDIEEGYLAPGQGGRGAGEDKADIGKQDQHRFISQNFDSTNSEVFVIFAQAFTGTQVAYSHISWLEFE